MTVYYGNTLQSSSGNQGRIQLDVNTSGPDGSGNVTVYYSYQYWSRYPVTDSSNTFAWSDPSSSGSFAASIAHAGNGYVTTIRSGSFTVATGYYGGNAHFSAYITGINAVPGTSTVDVYHPLPSLPPIVPNAPGTPYAVSLAPGSVILAWSGSSFNGGANVDSYLLRVYPPSGGYVDHSSENNLSRMVSGLVPGATYTFGVYAHNAIGYSAQSGTYSVKIPAYPPSAVRNLTATGIGPVNATLSYAAPADNGGAPVLDYLIRYWVGDTTTGSYVDVGTTTGLSYSITGLLAGAKYTFGVYARNESGYSLVASVVVKLKIYVRINVGGTWKEVEPYVRDAGVWKPAAPYVRSGGVWKPTE